MKTRILLINFNEKEKKAASKLGIDADLGYLSDVYTAIAHDGSEEQGASFYSPYAIYDYKAIFIRLTKTPPLEDQFKDKAQVIGKKEKTTFLKYWYDQKGIISIFAENCNFNSLILLGIPQVKLTDSRGNDKTVFFSLKTDDRPVRIALEELKSLAVIPPKKYNDVEEYKSRDERKDWTIFPIYNNRNDEDIGIYLNWGYSFSNTDDPAFLILPQFKEYPKVITKLLKAYARSFPKYFSEINDLDWAKNDQYFPKEVSLIDNEIKHLVEETETKVKSLREEKAKLKLKYSYLGDLLTESGDKLKDSVINTLQEVFNLNVKDMDKDKKTNFKEDILIQDNSFSSILTEVKGTKKSYPSSTYITQVFSNLLKGRDDYPDAIGGLILNFDRKKEPSDRADVYTKADEKKQLEEIVFIDTRVLFELAMAVLDHGMSIAEAKSVLLQKGRVSFSLKDYIKKQSNGNHD